MTNMTRTLLSSVFLLWLGGTAFGQTTQQPAPATPPEPDYPVVRVGVLSYLQYAAELENRDGFNNFDVTRGYLNVNGQLARNVRFRLTPDIRRATTDSTLAGSLVLRIKYAFAQFDNLTPRSWVRFGVHQTPWLDFEESINRYRVQGTMFSEREGLIPGSGDFGVGYFTPLPDNYGEIQAGVYNGEGFTQAEVNKYKSVQGRVTVRPLPGAGLANGFRVTGFYSAGWYAEDRPRNLGIVMGSYEHTHIVATAQYLMATESPSAVQPRDIDRKGSSVFLEIRQAIQGWAALGRVDFFDPDKATGNNSQRRIIAGGAYWFVWPRSRVGLVATNEQVQYDSPTRADENRLLIQTHIEF
jgi:hypothetical protein